MGSLDRSHLIDTCNSCGKRLLQARMMVMIQRGKKGRLFHRDREKVFVSVRASPAAQKLSEMKNLKCFNL